MKQATATEPPHRYFATHEPALRYGYAAQQQYADQGWDDRLESTLRTDYSGNYDVDRETIRYGYGYKTNPRKTG